MRIRSTTKDLTQTNVDSQEYNDIDVYDDSSDYDSDTTNQNEEEDSFGGSSGEALKHYRARLLRMQLRMRILKQMNTNSLNNQLKSKTMRKPEVEHYFQYDKEQKIKEIEEHKRRRMFYKLEKIGKNESTNNENNNNTKVITNQFVNKIEPKDDFDISMNPNKKINPFRILHTSNAGIEIFRPNYSKYYQMRSQTPQSCNSLSFTEAELEINKRIQQRRKSSIPINLDTLTNKKSTKVLLSKSKSMLWNPNKTVAVAVSPIN
jgi:hypothetical protein